MVTAGLATVSTTSSGPVTGFVVVDKPAGWTSHDIVARMRRLAGTRKVGHAGTLDPMATGVLVVGIGQATRLLSFVTAADKAYDATIRLGVTTVTDDAEGEVTGRTDASAVAPEAIAEVVAALTGDIEQVPSSVSAIKVDGKRSYARVRAGEDVQLKARPVTVSIFEVGAARPGVEEGFAFHDLDVSVTVSSGTYVRALARDLGEALGVGGHLTALRRTRVAGFTLGDATPLEELSALVEAGGVLAAIPLADAATGALPSRAVSADDAAALRFGRRIPRDPADGDANAARPLALLSPEGDLVALAVTDGSLLRPITVFAADGGGEFGASRAAAAPKGVTP
jgi:tRNA pseudouridine55 synthase